MSNSSSTIYVLLIKQYFQNTLRFTQRHLTILGYPGSTEALISYYRHPFKLRSIDHTHPLNQTHSCYLQLITIFKFSSPIRKSASLFVSSFVRGYPYAEGPRLCPFYVHCV